MTCGRKPCDRGARILPSRIALTDRIRCAAALALVALVVAGCGGGSGDGASKPTATSQTASGSASPDPEKAARAGGDPTEVADVPFPTALAFDDKGGLWVTSGSRGKQPTDGVWQVPGGGRPRHVAKDLTGALGLTWAAKRLYVSHVVSAHSGRVTVLTSVLGSLDPVRETT